MRTVTAAQMAEIDRRAQEDLGVPQERLMENAGRAVFEEILKSSGGSFPAGKKTAFVCGKGNNGGDAFVAARYAEEYAPGTAVVFVPDVAAIKQGAALDNYKKLLGMGVEMRPLTGFTGAGYKVIVDGILGTGFSGELREPLSSVCAKINSSGALVVSVDVPSGLDATTGKASASCVKAHVTVTFGLPKTGFYRQDGPGFCGDIVVADIGFPKTLIDEYAQ